MKNNNNNILIYKKKLPLTKVIDKINHSNSKTLFIINKKLALIGSITDGDIRRFIIKHKTLNGVIDEVINKKPIFILKSKNKLKNFNDFLKSYQIKAVPIVDSHKKIIEIIFETKKLSKNKKKYKNLNKISVLVMAGGKGQRLKPLSNILPKPLIPIKNEPIINMIIKEFQNYKIKNFVLSINNQLEIIKTYLKSNYKKLSISYIFENKPLGTIGSLSLIKKISQDFFVTNCDTIIKYDYNKIYNYHKSNKNIITLVCSDIETTSPYGECVTNSENKLINIIEKPKRKLLAMTGLYIFNKKIIKYIPTNKKMDMNILLLRLIKLGLNIGVYKLNSESWIDIGNWEKYKQVSENNKIDK